MTNEMEITGVDKSLQKQKSLLAKYKIPIDHLSYEHIQGCKNVKELEKIVKILRSGEEGHFPDLQKTAEERLRELCPNNRHLRTEEPALNRSCFNKKEWGNILHDIEQWKSEVSNREKQLYKNNDCNTRVMNLPPVRKESLLAKQSSESVSNKPKLKKKINDYASWDKYDVDTELLKIDLEEERKIAKEEKGEKRTAIKQTETDILELVNSRAQTFSEAEKLILAEQEKTKGNEYYRAKDYVEAEKRYTASLAIYPTANAYNNRAACYLKQRKYSEAVQDAENALKIDPNNIKALFRKGIALEHKGEFQKALENINAILRHEPNHLQAQNIAKQLKVKIHAQLKTLDCDLKISKPSPLNQVCLETKHFFAVNEWGLPKTLCCCRGALTCNNTQPASLPVFTPASEKKPGNVKIIELTDEFELPKQKTSTKLEIIEVEKSPHEPLDDFCRPKRCNVLDKRTLKKAVGYGGGDVI